METQFSLPGKIHEQRSVGHNSVHIHTFNTILGVAARIIRQGKETEDISIGKREVKPYLVTDVKLLYI